MKYCIHLTRLLLTIGLCFFMNPLSISQEIVTGRVVDVDGEPLIGVNIAILPFSEKRGTITDVDGYFEIRVEPRDTAIRITYVGFNEKLIELPIVDSLIVLERGQPIISGVIVVSRPETNERETVHQLDFSAIPASTYTSTDQILNIVPGVYMQTGSPNTKRLTIRGIGNRSPFASSGIKVFLDDIPLHGNNGESTLEDFGTNIISKAEVIKGPTGPSFGSGLGGAIVLKSEDGLYGKNAYVSTYNEIGPYGLFRTANTFELTSKPKGTKHRLRLQHSNLQSDGYRNNNNVDRNNLSLSYRLSHKAHTLRILSNYVNLFGQIPSALGITDYIDSPRKAAFIWDAANGFEDYKRSLLGLNYKYHYGLESSFSATIYGKGFNSLELRPFNTLQEDLATLGARLKVEHYIPLSKGTLVVKGGIDYQNEKLDIEVFETLDSVKGNKIEMHLIESNTSNTYFALDYYLDSGWYFNLGASYINYILENENQNKLDVNKVFPTATVTKKIGQSRIFFKVGAGGQFPTNEEFTEQNNDLKPVSGWNIETGIKGYARNLKLGYRLSLYQMSLIDQFVQRSTIEGQSFTINGGSSKLRGVEWSVRKRWYEKNFGEEFFESIFSGSYSSHEFDQFSDLGGDYSGNDFTGTPPITLQVSTVYHTDRWHTGFTFNYVDGFAIDDANTTYSDDYSVLNIFANYKVLNKKHWILTIGSKLQNVLDEKYASMISVNARSFGGEPRYYYAGIPRNLIGNLRLTYRI